MTSSLHFFCKPFLISLITFICQVLYIILYHNHICVWRKNLFSCIWLVLYNFLVNYSWLAGFSLLALWVCPWREPKLLMVAGEPMRHQSFSCDAAVATSYGWFKSEVSSPGQIFPWFLFSWYMCLMSFKILPKLRVAFFFLWILFFIYFWLCWIFATAVLGLLSVVASLDAERGL